MRFTPHTQNELNAMNLNEGDIYLIEYVNKDYYNGDETIEKADGAAIMNEGKIYFNVMDPYGMEKLIMNARIVD